MNLIKTIFIIIVLTFLVACGGGGSNNDDGLLGNTENQTSTEIVEKPTTPIKPENPDIPVTPVEPEIPDTREDLPSNASLLQVLKAGEMSVGETLTAESICENCVESETEYTWRIDMNADGIFSDDEPTSVSETLDFTREYYGKDIRLSAVAFDEEGISTEEKYVVYSKVVPIEIIAENSYNRHGSADSFVIRDTQNNTLFYSYNRNDSFNLGKYEGDKKYTFVGNTVIVWNESELNIYGENVNNFSELLKIEPSKIQDIKSCISASSNSNTISKSIIVLSKDGSLHVFGEGTDFIPPTGPQIQIASPAVGGRFCASLGEDGKITSIGDFYSSENNDLKNTGQSDDQFVTEIILGDFYGVGLLDDSFTPLFWGSNLVISAIEADKEKFSSPIKSVATPGEFVVFLLETGEVLSYSIKGDNANRGSSLLAGKTFNAVFPQNETGISGDTPFLGPSAIAIDSDGNMTGFGKEITDSIETNSLKNFNINDIDNITGDFHQVYLISKDRKTIHSISTGSNHGAAMVNTFTLKGELLTTASMNRATGFIDDTGEMLFLGLMNTTGAVSDFVDTRLNYVIDAVGLLNTMVLIQGDGSLGRLVINKGGTVTSFTSIPQETVIDTNNQESI
ncbi:MAG: hypothetical protein ACK5NC_06025 [Vibrio sp.]